MRVHFKTKQQSKAIKDKKREKEVLKQQRVRSRMNTVSDIQSLLVLIKFHYKKCTLTQMSSCTCILLLFSIYCQR